MTAPDAPFPTTSAASPGQYQEAFEAAFADGADAIVCVDIAETLSGTIKSARIAAERLPDREIHVIDSGTASMGVGLLALLAVELVGRGSPPRTSLRDWRRAGRTLISSSSSTRSPTSARAGGSAGPRRRSGRCCRSSRSSRFATARWRSPTGPGPARRARERVLELLSARPVERLAILYAPPAEARGLPRRAPRARCRAASIPTTCPSSPSGRLSGPISGRAPWVRRSSSSRTSDRLRPARPGRIHLSGRSVTMGTWGRERLRGYTPAECRTRRHGTGQRFGRHRSRAPRSVEPSGRRLSQQVGPTSAALIHGGSPSDDHGARRGARSIRGTSRSSSSISRPIACSWTAASAVSCASRAAS